MFTGIIQKLGRIADRQLSGEAGKLVIEMDEPFADPEHGESIAVNGTCLTLEKWSGKQFTFHVLAETFRRTNLGELPKGGVVNLERALSANGRFGGHIVTGHVDGTGEILKCERRGSDLEVTVSLPENIAPYLAPKGSIAIDGISLTLASLQETGFTVCIIPTTWEHTALRDRKPGARVNLEGDLIGKYVQHQLAVMLGRDDGKSPKKEITMDDLLNAGFGE
ncbi:MAG: riboflavin synthase [Lentisphaeria bacterium]|nr:riboflavin synthase [Lentisphaeria bacterium]